MESKNLWAPWRINYIRGLDKTNDCFICHNRDNPQSDEENLVVWRGEKSIVILNRYPYNNGHLLIAPLRHIPDFDQADVAVVEGTEVTFPATLESRPLDGRVLLVISRRGTPPPMRAQMRGNDAQPMFGVDVDRLKPGQPAVFDAGTVDEAATFDKPIQPARGIDTVIVNEHECRECFGRAPEELQAMPALAQCEPILSNQGSLFAVLSCSKKLNNTEHLNYRCDRGPQGPRQLRGICRQVVDSRI